MFDLTKDTPAIANTPEAGAAQDALPSLGDPQQHSLFHSTVLHLLPGPLVIRVGLPLLLVPCLWTLCVLLPFELGYLLYQGKNRNGRLSLRGIVLYREPMPIRSYIVLIPSLLVWGVLAFLTTQPTQPFLIRTLFSWVPTWVVSLFTSGNTGGHPPTILLLTVLLYLLTNPAAALVEELYFRGYLLPRLAPLRGWTPLVNTVLFCLYHLHSPWGFLGRLLGFLPIAVNPKIQWEISA